MSIDSRERVVIDRVIAFDIYGYSKRIGRPSGTIHLDSILVIVNLIVAIDRHAGERRIDNLNAVRIVSQFIPRDGQRVVGLHIGDSNR